MRCVEAHNDQLAIHRLSLGITQAQKMKILTTLFVCGFCLAGLVVIMLIVGLDDLRKF